MEAKLRPSLLPSAASSVQRSERCRLTHVIDTRSGRTGDIVDTRSGRAGDVVASEINIVN